MISGFQSLQVVFTLFPKSTTGFPVGITAPVRILLNFAFYPKPSNMKKTATLASKAALPILFSGILIITSCGSAGTGTNSYASDTTTMATKDASGEQQQLDGFIKNNEAVQKNLTTFDTLDFTVFSNQEWTRLHESHAKDIKVHWPDGHTEDGLDTHIESLKKIFLYAPDTRIKVHPIRFGSGQYTAVTGVMEGTFTKPMTMPDGTVVQPTGKAYKVPMATIGVWKDGVMSEEYLYWDNQTYMKQIEVGK